MVCLEKYYSTSFVLALIFLSVALYLYIENKNLTKNTEQRTIEQNAVMTELNDFKREPVSTKSIQDTTKELNSFKSSITTTNTATTNNNSSTTTQQHR